MDMDESSQDESAPIIVKKKGDGHGGHHGGAWKVAYADFVTAMMALFIVLWVLGQSAEVKESVASYFKDPIGFAKNGGNNVIPGKEEGFINPSFIQREEMRLKEYETEKFNELSEKIVEKLNEDSEFEDMIDQVEMKVTTDGLRIEMVESTEDIFFELGSSQLNTKARNLLHTIGNQLSKMPNLIVIEGHTDARPFTSKGQYYTNFELSADRANAARRELLIGGLKNYQIAEIRGYADRLLKDKENPFSVKNRRISITVKYTNAEKATDN